MAQFYTLEEAARVLGMSPEDLKLKAQHREVRAFMDSGSWQFRVADVDELARRRGLGRDPDLSLSDLELEVPDGPAPRRVRPVRVPDRDRPGRPRRQDRRHRVEPLRLDDEHDVQFDDLSLPPGPISNSSSTIIGMKPGGKQPSDSDVRLMPEQPMKGTSDSDVRIRPAEPMLPSDSDVTLVNDDDASMPGIEALGYPGKPGAGRLLGRDGRRRRRGVGQRLRAHPVAVDRRGPGARERQRLRAHGARRQRRVRLLARCPAPATPTSPPPSLRPRASTWPGPATRGSTSRGSADSTCPRSTRSSSPRSTRTTTGPSGRPPSPRPSPPPKAAPPKAASPAGTVIQSAIQPDDPGATSMGMSEKDIFEDTDFSLEVDALDSDRDDRTVQIDRSSDFDLEESDSASEVFALDEDDVDQNAATAMGAAVAEEESGEFAADAGSGEMSSGWDVESETAGAPSRRHLRLRPPAASSPPAPRPNGAGSGSACSASPRSWSWPRWSSPSTWSGTSTSSTKRAPPRA